MNFTETTPTPFYKKKPVLIIGGILLLALLGKMCGGNGDKTTTTSTTQTETTTTSQKIESGISEKDANEKALTEIRKEKKVIEAFLSDANVLYISVKDDGTRRDGYAEYICQVIKENGSKIDRVKITKVGSTNDPDRDNAYGVLLGECYCK
jgi:hypothetical protein